MKLTKRLGAILMMAMLVLAMSMSASAAKAKINKKNLKLTVGQTANLKVKNTTGKVKWSSSDATVATVKKGKVTAVKAGTAVITAKNKKKTYKCNVTVEEAKTTPSTEAPTTTPKTEEPKSQEKLVKITDENFAQEFDKYFGKVVISTYYLDQYGNLLSPDNYIKYDPATGEGGVYTKTFNKKGKETGREQVEGGAEFPMVIDTYAYYLKDGRVSDLLTYGFADMQYHINLYELNITGNKPVFAKLLATNPLQKGYYYKKPEKGANEGLNNSWRYPFNGDNYTLWWSYNYGEGEPANASQRIKITRMNFPKAESTDIWYQYRTQYNDKVLEAKGKKVVSYSVPSIAGRMMFGFDYGTVASTCYYDGDVIKTGQVTMDSKTDRVKQVTMLKIEDEVFRNVNFNLYLR